MKEVYGRNSLYDGLVSMRAPYVCMYAEALQMARGERRRAVGTQTE